jgi:hypothetical protein
MQVTTFSLHKTVRNLLLLSDAELRAVFHSPSLDAGLLEFLRDILQALHGGNHFIGDVLLSVKAILQRITIDVPMSVILGTDFLNSPDFLSVFAVVKLYLKILADAHADIALALLMVENNVEDPHRLEVFQCPDALAALGRLMFPPAAT